MGRSLDPVWEFYYRIEQDVQSLGLKAKANSAHNNGWCKNCVRMKLVGPEMATWVPDDSVLAETGQIETARRYKAMSLCQPYTGVPSRLRSHLQRCSHSQGIMIPDAVPLKKRKSHPGSPGTETGPSGTHSTPLKAGGRGKLSDEQQGEFNVHLWHIFNMLDIPIETLTNPTFVQFFSKYIPQATLPSRSLFYTLSASRNIAPPNLSSAAATVGPTGSPDFQGLARLAAGFASVPGVSGVSELSGVQGESGVPHHVESDGEHEPDLSHDSQMQPVSGASHIPGVPGVSGDEISDGGKGELSYQ
ncbi:hypothetical protein AYX15_04782 [Cryptococcus neoformans]|nr:hypothetical protein AYX15_04782 [Cryptococcus neoformans var. grubii]